MESGSIQEISEQLKSWCILHDRGLARVEWNSAYARQAVVNRLKRSLASLGIPLVEIGLPPGKAAHETVAGLIEKLRSQNGSVASITGIEWAFPEQGSRLDTLVALSFQRETLASLPVRQIWWVPSRLTEQFVLGVPDLDSWFRLRLYLTEVPAAPEHHRLPTLAILLSLSGWAALGFSTYTKLIPTVAAAIGAVIWTALVGLTSIIWARVEKTLVELIGDWLDIHIRDFASRYRKRYFQHLEHRHRTFDVKGLSTQGIYALEIEQVYVELTVDPRQASEASPDPIAKTGPGGRHDIWSLLNSPQMKRQDFAILGAPGSGKTTLLKHITLGLAANRGKFHGIERTPVLLFIRDHVAAIGSNPNQSISDVAHEAASKMGIPGPAGWFQREFDRGRCLVMLDGLDEVADATLRKTVADWVERQMQAFGANRFLVTSRPFGYRSNPLSQVTVLEVRPFSSEQSERFIANWYLANEVISAQKNDEGARMAARDGAADLLGRIRANPALAELAVNPLLLTMIANVHRYRSILPGRRVELYAEICEVFLGKRQEARGMELELTPAQKKRVLQPLAFHMMFAEKREIPLTEAVRGITGPLALVNPKMSAEEFLRMVENSSGLLLERENGVYSFAHLTFQEFLAASHSVDEKLEEELAARVAIPWWHEVIRQYVALSDATRIVEACLADGEPSVAKLTLAVECLEEALAVRPDLRSKVESIVIDGLEAFEPERARLAAETKLALRLRRLTRVDDDHYADSDLISCAEYQLFVDDLRATGDYRQPDHWSGTHFPAGSARQPVLGARPSDAKEFCLWLTERHGGEWTYQIPDRDLGGEPRGPKGYWAQTPSGPKLYGTSGGAAIQLRETMLRARYFADLGRMMAVSALDPESALARVCAFARERVPALDLDRALHGVRALALALESDRTFALDPALASVRTFLRYRASALARGRGLERGLVLTLTGALARDLDRALDRAFSRIVLLESVSILESDARPKARRYAWLTKRLQVPSDDSYSRLVDDFLDVLVGLAILEERIEGKLPAFEGVRITKVRRAATPTPASLVNWEFGGRYSIGRYSIGRY